MKSYTFFGLSAFLNFYSEEGMSRDDIKAKSSFSLFYTEEELTRQNDFWRKEPSVFHRIHLQALFYSGPHLWTLWINNCKILSSHPHPDYHIRHVTSESVQLVWIFEGETHFIQLRPNQTYDAVKKQVIEGL